MLIKIMSDDGLPDGDPRKCFMLITDLVEVEFTHQPQRIWVGKGVEAPDGFLHFPGPFALGRRADGAAVKITLRGNVYVLDEFGKTMDRFIVDPIRPQAPPQPPQRDFNLNPRVP